MPLLLSLAGVLGLGVPPSHALFLSRDDEVRIGRDVDRDIVKQYGLSKDAKGNERVQRIAAEVVKRSSRSGKLQFHFRLLATDQVNALAAPGGYVYATDGLLDFIGHDDEALACILGHEIAHVDKEHGVDNLERALGTQLAIGLVLGGDSTKRIVSVAANLVLLGYSRDQERQADRVGMRYADEAGYDARGMVRFLEKLLKAKGSSSKVETFFQTHPATKDRLARAKKFIENQNL